MQHSNDTILQFQQDKKMSDPQGKELEIITEINSLKEKIEEAEENILALNKIQLKIDGDPNRVELYKTLPEIAENPNFSSLNSSVQSLISLHDKREELLYVFTSNNREIRNIDKRIKSLLNTIRKNLKTTEEKLSESVITFTNEINELEENKTTIPSIKRKYLKLKNVIDVSEKYYKMFEEKKFTYSMSNAGYHPSNQILSFANIPSDPFSPNTQLIFISFISCGLILGLAYLTLKYLTFNEINNI